jgi:hypothetical protein
VTTDCSSCEKVPMPLPPLFVCCCRANWLHKPRCAAVQVTSAGGAASTLVLWPVYALHSHSATKRMFNQPDLSAASSYLPTNPQTSWHIHVSVGSQSKGHIAVVHR